MDRMIESPSTPPPRVSDDLRRILSYADGNPMGVAAILAHTRGRGLQTMVIILALPFLSPVAIPGLSMPFGVAIAICGLRIAMRHEPWLPGFLLRREIPFAVLDKTLRFGIAIQTRLEKLLCARWPIFVASQPATMVCGFGIVVSAFLLSLPIPPPFPLTNTLPGFAIIFIALGMLERDGLVIALGYTLCLLSALYVTGIILLGGAGAAGIWHWLSGFAGSSG